MASYGQTQIATIASGQARSSAVWIGSDGVVAIDLPAAWTAADVTLLAADAIATNDGSYPVPALSAFRQVYTAGAEQVLAAGGYTTAATGLAGIRLDVPSPFLVDADWIIVQSGTTGGLVNQGGARTIGVRTRPV